MSFLKSNIHSIIKHGYYNLNIFIFVIFIGSYYRNHNPNTSKHMWALDTIACLLLIVNIICFCVSGMLVLNNFTSPGLFSSILPESTNVLVKRVVNLPIAYIIFISYCIFFIILSSISYGGAPIIWFVIKELKLGRPIVAYRSSYRLRKVPNFVIIYKATFVLISRLNELIGWLLLPSELSFTLLFVMSSLVLIKFPNILQTEALRLIAIFAVAGASGWSVILYMAGYLNLHGRKILLSWKRHSWKTPTETKLMSRLKVCCRPLMICNGKLFIIQRATLLVFLRRLVKTLVKTLITFDRKFNVPS